MKQDYLEKLEYYKILEFLSYNCKTNFGKKLVSKLSPSFNKEKVSNLLAETNEAYLLLHRKGLFSLYELEDIAVYLKQLQSNVNLSIKALLDIGKILKISRELKQYFYEDEDFPIGDFPILSSYFSSFYTNISLEKSIFNCIIDENNIADNASSKLSILRRNKIKLENDIKEILNTFIHSSNYSKYIMESIITIRNDRYVIPVKEEFRGNIKGFIHDISSSGSTVFIEPIQVFELNNKINSLKIEESIEIERILEELSKSIVPYINELFNNVYWIGKIDFIFAKANLAKSMNAVYPIINNSKEINLIKAIHPLISKDLVVPIDIKIGVDYTSLIITGPNTGGKTVCLKTVGLLLLMAYSGLFIPTDENSSIYVFDSIFADIGDEQSIQESLSTFSSHIVNIVNIINNATQNSLVLLDELGSGTDPLEGSSLAISILEHFNKLGSIILATTHYQEIKNYALISDGFENASFEFDLENLKPTYKLLIGIPGKSNAFSISKKLGLSDDILERAKSFLTKQELDIEELLKSIYDDRILIEKEKEEIEKNLNQVSLLRESLEQELNTQKQYKNQNLEKSKQEASNIILNAKKEVNDIIKELNNLCSSWKELDNLNISSLSNNEIALFVRNHLQKDSLKKANILRNSLNDSLNNNFNHKTEDFLNNSFVKTDLKIGMNLRVLGFSDIATITSLSGKENQVQVQVGNAKMNIKLDNILEILNDVKSPNSYNSTYKNIKTSSFKAKNVSPEINVIGQNIEDACFIIDKYLDNCILSKISPIRIVHGKGTGKLREGIHSFLKKHPHVEGFRLGTFGEGEMGVTIVNLKL